MPTVTMFSTVWCGYCRRLKNQMSEAGIPFQEIDLDEVPGKYDDMIIEMTGGYRTVPTLEIHGKLYVNPSIKEVKAAVVA
ncbi:MAG: glutaredoxin family protein [Actinomycetota bacterium]